MAFSEVKNVKKMFGETDVKLQIHGFRHPNTAGVEMVYRVDVEISDADTKTVLFNSEGKQLDAGFNECDTSGCAVIPEEYMELILKEVEVYKKKIGRRCKHYALLYWPSGNKQPHR